MLVAVIECLLAILASSECIRPFVLKELEPSLLKTLAAKEPAGLFKIWFEKAKKTEGILEPNAMTLTTASREGQPSVRYMLLKGYSKDGFTFFTNYNSRKARHLDLNPRAAMMFYWEPLHSSIKIQGHVYKTKSRISDMYFKSRSVDSQFSISVSEQSEVIESRQKLFEKLQFMKTVNDMMSAGDLFCPKNWGGYVMLPNFVKFWSRDKDRLDGRITFRKRNRNFIVNNVTKFYGDDDWVFQIPSR